VTLPLLLRRALPFLAVALCAAVIYDIAVFYSRWSSARQAERARREQEIRAAQQTVDMLGGGGLKILQFYASPAVVRRGGHSQLCYGVTGAKAVLLDPPSADVHPALSYCLSVAPAKDTEYKLTADDGAGHTVTAICRLEVTR
jgi:hypothetical protein